MSKTTKQPTTTLDWAREYIKRAWPVLPCYSVKPDGDCTCPPRHGMRRKKDGTFDTCKSPGKHPASHLVPDGSSNASTDSNQIKQWFSTDGEYNIAVATGQNKQGWLTVVDLDVRKGKDGPGVHTALIEAANKPLPVTLSQTTGSGGKQYLWWSAGEVKNNAETKLGHGIDIRGTGGYVVVAPSANDLGSYCWDNWGPPHAVLTMPDWYESLCVNGVSAPQVPVTARTASTPQHARQVDDPNDRLTLAQVQELLTAIPPSHRDHWMMFGHVLRTIADWIGGEQKAFEVWDGWAATGDGYGGLKDQQYHWGTFTEPTQHPIALLIGHARDNSWKPSEEFHRAGRQSRSEAARKALDSLPANASPEDLRPVLALIVKLPAMDQDGFLKELKNKTKISIGALRREMPMGDDTDDSDAGMIVAKQVLADHYEGGRLLIRSIDKAFWYYNARFWEPVKNDDEIRGRCLAPTLALGPMKMTVNSVARQALQLLEAMQAKPGDPLRLTQPPLPVVNCRNGELWINDDLTVDLRPHRPESYLTHGLDIDYDPAATCPMFDKALLAIFQDSSNPAEMARHAMELFGYIIQPRRKYKAFWLLYGGGDNGKSSFVKIIISIINPRCVHPARINSLESSEYLIAHLCGKLLYVDDDVDARTTLPDGILKQISEEKLMQGRDPYGKPREFLVTVVPMLLVNNYPHSKDLSYGTQVRAHVIPFKHKFRDGIDLDRKLFDRIREHELAGILNRAIEGLQRLEQRGGFLEPADCLDAKAEFMAQSNPLPQFIRQSCFTQQALLDNRRGILDMELRSVSSPEARRSLEQIGNAELARLSETVPETALEEFYRTFRAWCDSEGIKVPARKSDVRRDLEHMSYPITDGTKDGCRGQLVVRGLALSI